jgi:ferritin-like metal-binding protein YciE
VARKRTQAKRGGTTRKKAAASSRSKTKTAASRKKSTAATRSRSKVKTASRSRAKTKTTSRSRAKTASARSRAKTKTASRSRAKTKTTSRSRAKVKTAGRTRAKTASTRARKTAAARRAPARAPKRLGSLDEVLQDQLADLYSAEKQLVEALPKMARAATHPRLREAFETHLEETRGHTQRLERIFSTRGKTAPSEHCEGMEGLIKEGDEVVSATGDPAAKDAALIAAAQRVEHYEMAGYGTARTLADQLGMGDAKDMLQETLDEEGKADELLTQIATGGLMRTGVNEQAAMR